MTSRFTSSLTLTLSLLLAQGAIVHATPAPKSATKSVATSATKKLRVKSWLAKGTVALVGAYTISALAPSVTATVGAIVSPIHQQTVSAVGQPQLSDGYTSMLTWSTAQGTTLFGKGGPKATDVVQGAVGDCAWISAFSAEAKANPDILKHAIAQTPDGKYLVRLYDLKQPIQDVTVTANGKLVPQGAVVAKQAAAQQKIVVDGSLPRYTKSEQFLNAQSASQYRLAAPAYAKSKDASQLWGPLLEKGVAQASHGYATLDDGDQGARTLSALSGKVSQRVSLPGASLQGTWLAMSTAITSHRAVVAGTPYESATQWKLELHGLVSNHTYSVLGTKSVDGKEMVVLRNPWGARTQIAGLNVGAGIFTLSMSTFMTTFENVAIN